MAVVFNIILRDDRGLRIKALNSFAQIKLLGVKMDHCSASSSSLSFALFKRPPLIIDSYCSLAALELSGTMMDRRVLVCRPAVATHPSEWCLSKSHAAVPLDDPRTWESPIPQAVGAFIGRRSPALLVRQMYYPQYV